MANRPSHARLGHAVAVLALISCIGPLGLAASEQPTSDNRFAAEGVYLASHNQLKDAEAAFRRAVALSPKSAIYLADLGGVLGMEHKLADSAMYLKEALALDPNNTAARRDLASTDWQMGHPQEAKQNLLRILRANPQDPPTILLLGMVADNLKDYASAIRLLESVQPLVKSRPAAILALADSYYHARRPQEARRALNNLLGNPSDPRSVFLGGQLAGRVGDYRTGEELLRSILSTYPDRDALGYELASLQYKSGAFNESEETLLGVVEDGHRSLEIYNLLFRCYRKQGKLKEAAAVLDRAIDSVGRSEPGCLRLARMLLKDKAYPAAEIAAKWAAALAPDSAEAYEVKGETELDLQFFRDADRDYSRALQLDRSSAKANLGLALAEWGSGMIPQATATFEQNLKRFPNDPDQYVKYARMLLKSGKEGNQVASARAIAVLKSAIALDRSRAEPYFLLGKFFLDHGNAATGLRDLKLAASLDPDRGDIHFALWRAYRRAGQNQAASRELAEYRSLRTTEADN